MTIWVAIFLYHHCNHFVIFCSYLCGANGNQCIGTSIMNKEKAEKNVKIYNWFRVIIFLAFLTFVFVALAYA